MPTDSGSLPYPSTPTESIGTHHNPNRWDSLDVLRGFALLGILVMNIQSFAMPGAAYLNPSAYGDLSGVNRWVWYFSALLADTKFMTLFSVLFGAGVLLMRDRCLATDRPAARIHYRRMAGLLLIGMIHAYGFWLGDILVPYAICGALIYPLVRLPIGWLWAIAIVLLSVRVGIDATLGWSMPYWGEEALTEIREQDWRPSAEAMQAELDAYRGSWWQQLQYRVPATFMMQSFVFPLMLFWRISACMLIGAALMKQGILTGQRGRRVYVAMVVFGLTVGLGLVAWGIHQNEVAKWSLEYSFFWGTIPNFVGSLFVAAGYIGLLELIRRGPFGNTLNSVLGPVGRLALSNYLFQTAACSILFYGIGLGWIGNVPRVEQFAIVLGIWAIQLIVSAIWVRRFRYGPAEYVWRKMTYGFHRPTVSEQPN